MYSELKASGHNTEEDEQFLPLEQEEGDVGRMEAENNEYSMEKVVQNIKELGRLV